VGVLILLSFVLFYRVSSGESLNFLLPSGEKQNKLFLRDIGCHLAVEFTTSLPPSSAQIYNHFGKLKNYRENDKGRENPLRHTLENKSGARSLFFHEFPPSALPLFFFSVTGMCPVMLPNKKKAQ